MLVNIICTNINNNIQFQQNIIKETLIESFVVIVIYLAMVIVLLYGMRINNFEGFYYRLYKIITILILLGILVQVCRVVQCYVNPEQVIYNYFRVKFR